jgi:hypothetical protein
MPKCGGKIQARVTKNQTSAANPNYKKAMIFGSDWHVAWHLGSAIRISN